MDTQELQRALALHHQGQLQQAESIFRELALCSSSHGATTGAASSKKWRQ